MCKWQIAVSSIVLAIALVAPAIAQTRAQPRPAVPGVQGGLPLPLPLPNLPFNLPDPLGLLSGHQPGSDPFATLLGKFNADFLADVRAAQKLAETPDANGIMADETGAKCHKAFGDILQLIVEQAASQLEGGGVITALEKARILRVKLSDQKFKDACAPLLPLLGLPIP